MAGSKVRAVRGRPGEQFGKLLTGRRARTNTYPYSFSGPGKLGRPRPDDDDDDDGTAGRRPANVAGSLNAAAGVHHLP